MYYFQGTCVTISSLSSFSIQTQYEFIHEALLETIMCGDTSLPVKSLTQHVIELGRVDPVTGKSGFLTQFQVKKRTTLVDVMTIHVYSLYCRHWSRPLRVMRSLIAQLLKYLTTFLKQDQANIFHVGSNH